VLRPWRAWLAGAIVAGALAASWVTSSAGQRAAPAPASRPAAASPSGASPNAVDPVPVDAGEARVPLPDGSWWAVRWDPCRPVTVRVNLAAVDPPARLRISAEIGTAVARLSAATGLRLVDAGSTAEVPGRGGPAQDGELVVAVVDPTDTDLPIGGEEIGHGGYVVGYRSGAVQITRGWVVLDVRRFLSLATGFGPGVDRGNVLLHELGHAVGLEHVAEPGSLMRDTLGADAPDGFAPGDLARLRRRGADGGCVRPAPAAVTRVATMAGRMP
jgi:hypothetical protein